MRSPKPSQCVPYSFGVFKERLGSAYGDVVKIRRDAQVFIEEPTHSCMAVDGRVHRCSKGLNLRRGEGRQREETKRPMQS